MCNFWSSPFPWMVHLEEMISRRINLLLKFHQIKLTELSFARWNVEHKTWKSPWHNFASWYVQNFQETLYQNGLILYILTIHLINREVGSLNVSARVFSYWQNNCGQWLRMNIFKKIWRKSNWSMCTNNR